MLREIPIPKSEDVKEVETWRIAIKRYLGKMRLLNPVVSTTIGAAGGATALPATPLGYITTEITIQGVTSNVKIPYYNI